MIYCPYDACSVMCPKCDIPMHLIRRGVWVHTASVGRKPDGEYLVHTRIHAEPLDEGEYHLECLNGCRHDAAMLGVDIAALCTLSTQRIMFGLGEAPPPGRVRVVRTGRFRHRIHVQRVGTVLNLEVELAAWPTDEGSFIVEYDTAEDAPLANTIKRNAGSVFPAITRGLRATLVQEDRNAHAD